MTYTNATTTALPTSTLQIPTLKLSAAPVVGDAVAAVPVEEEDVDVEDVVFELSVPLAFVFVPVYLVAVTPVPLVQGPGWAVEEKVMSAHWCESCVRGGSK